MIFKRKIFADAVNTRSLKNRFPTLMAGIVVLSITVLLLGGKAFVFDITKKASAQRDAPPIPSVSAATGKVKANIITAANQAPVALAQDDDLAGFSDGGCCGGGGVAPGFANGRIPTDNIQIAKVVDGVQQAKVKVDSYGYSPAVIVIERGKKFSIKFDVAEINGCNNIVYFPDYGGGLDLTQYTATPELTADDDFTFECSMGMLHGYVKVVDDLNNVDLGSVKRDVESFVPSNGNGGGCCSRP